MTVVSMQTTKYRLARHYLNKLRTADAAVRRGLTSAAYGFKVFDQEWEQIRFWQGWTARGEYSDTEKTLLCKEFSLAGLEILAIRNNVTDQASWLMAALEAARQLQDGEAERALCYELLMTYYRLGISEKIEYFANQLLRLGDAAKDSLCMERGLFGYGLVAEERGMFAEAESYYQRALQLSLELGKETEIGQCLNGLGAVATYMGDYQKAVSYFERQLELMEASGKKNEICHALLSMGGVLLWQKDYANAESYLQRAVEMSQVLGLRRLLGVSLIHLGASALEQNQLEVAYRNLGEGLEIVRRIGVTRQIMSGLSLLGYTLLRMGDPSAAFAHLQEGLELARRSRSPRNIFDLQCNLAKTNLVLNDLDSASNALKELLALAQSLGGHQQKVEAVSIAAAAFRHLGRNAQAAVWAGVIWGDVEIDQHLFAPVCNQLELALGAEVFRRAIEEGQQRKLDDVITEIINTLA